MTGTLSKKNAKGFGFIVPDDADGSHIFMHATALPRGTFDLLSVGDRLVFDIDLDAEGRRRAVDARIVSDDDDDES